VTNQPTSSPVSGFTKMNEQGYCLDASNEFYSAFKSNPLPLSTSDANCLSWCAQNLHPLLVAVETYRSADSLTCYCDFSGDAVPNTIDLSDYNPAALSAVINLGVGKVQSTDSSSGASCYRYVVSNILLSHVMQNPLDFIHNFSFPLVNFHKEL
jgi:hypothetical protein